MVLVGSLLKLVSTNMIWQFAVIALCVVVYFVALYVLPGGKAVIRSLLDIVVTRKKKN